MGKKGGAVSLESFSEPAFVAERLSIWEEFMTAQAERNNASKEHIVITLPDGTERAGESGVTTPLEVATAISKGLAQRAIISRVDGTELWDLTRPLVRSCSLEILDFNSEEGKHVFWHSSAHVLGEALEFRYGAQLCYGPPIDEGGFFYDVFMGEDKVKNVDFEELNAFIAKIMKDKQPFERCEITKQQAMRLFAGNPFKQEFIAEKVGDDEITTAYRCGPLIDLCKGPHLPNTGAIKAFDITKNSGSYWKADVTRENLQRVYGIAFPDKKLMKEYKKFQELAAKRDHRKIGEDQQLFFFDKLSPGSCFFLPHGTRIYNGLMEIIRDQYRKRGFEEVITPNVFNLDLWATSGHLDNYKDNMFIFECEKQEFGLKPMNCPGHCLMFKHGSRSYRELPLRLADFGVLHRNELSGALTGLTRVRRFQQDDAHIFCRPEQIFDEVLSALDFMQEIYGIFGFKFNLALSTRPEKALGDIKMWDQAEEQLRQVLDKFGHPWTLNPGDGAFYGPKIDVQVTDALKRKHQCATIQLDFQLPIRFDLQYKSSGVVSGDSENIVEGFERPVIIHRAVLGSVERFIAVLTEHCGGKWPLWISPRQVMIVPVSLKFIDYANSVRAAIHTEGYYVDVDASTLTLNKKIRTAQLAQYNYILVVGAEEVEAQSVNVRSRNNKVHGTKTLPELFEMFKSQCDNRKMDEDVEMLE